MHDEPLRAGVPDDQVTPWALNIPPVTLPDRLHRDFHLLLWQVRGRSDFLIAGESYELAMGHVLWLPAGLGHSVTVQQNSVMMPLFFGVEETATTLEGVSIHPVDAQLYTLSLALVQATYSAIQPNINLRRQILALIEETPVIPMGLPMPTTPAARTVAETLRFNPGDDRHVHDWASLTHSSKRSIERAFLAETGYTLQVWRQKTRMEAAAILLRRATVIAAVARRVGYTNQSAFGRVFKAHFGMSSGEYARQYRGAQRP